METKPSGNIPPIPEAANNCKYLVVEEVFEESDQEPLVYLLRRNKFLFIIWWTNTNIYFASKDQAIEFLADTDTIEQRITELKQAYWKKLLEGK